MAPTDTGLMCLIVYNSDIYFLIHLYTEYVRNKGSCQNKRSVAPVNYKQSRRHLPHYQLCRCTCSLNRSIRLHHPLREVLNAQWLEKGNGNFSKGHARSFSYSAFSRCHLPSTECLWIKKKDPDMKRTIMLCLDFGKCHCENYNYCT